jgi:hypothetical protein
MSAWYEIGNPMLAAEGWTFDGTKFVEAKIHSGVVINMVLSSQEMATCIKIINEDKLIPGHYETWQEFCLAHGIESL